MTAAASLRVKILALSSPTSSKREGKPLCILTLEIDDAIRIDGVELHRDPVTEAHFLRFPVWIDAFGQRHSIVRPTTSAVRRAILLQILAALNAGFPNPRPTESP